MIKIIVLASIGLANLEVGHQDETVLPQEFRDGSPQTVVIPGADQRYVVMSEEWYDGLTNRMAATERDMAIVRGDYEKTEEGRVKFHGKRIRYSVDAENLTHTAFYEDGWHITERFAPRKANNPTGSRAALVSPGSGDGGMDAAAHRKQGYEAAQRKQGYEAAQRKQGYEAAHRKQGYEAAQRKQGYEAAQMNPRYEAVLKRREAAKKPVEKTVIHEGGK